MNDAPLLTVEDLHVTLPTAHGPAEAVRGVSLALRRGETAGLIGESGCGKSLTALAIAGLLPEGAGCRGRVRFAGQSLLDAAPRTLDALRGDRIGFVFQEPLSALDPLQRIGDQVAEPLRRHRGLNRRDARAAALALLQRVHLPDAAARLDAWPHQLSGGQRQRVMIASALACGPDLLIADEPTTALDATLQHEMLALIGELVRERGLALLLISHDLALMARHVATVHVMYAGHLVEHGPAAEVLRRPAHPYTRGLLAARPQLGRPRGEPLPTIPGRVPPLHAVPPGCPFAARCGWATDACRAGLPAWHAAGPAQAARCIRLAAVATEPPR